MAQKDRGINRGPFFMLLVIYDQPRNRQVLTYCCFDRVAARS